VPVRESYHHGNLKSALLDAAVVSAREGGEQAIGLNKLATAVGVSASAAYRHFPGGLEELLAAVGDVARTELAELILLRMSQTAPSRDARTMARRRFRASGEAYVEYVLAQPGLFQVACRHEGAQGGGSAPFLLLEGCIDDLAANGLLPRDRRPHAAVAAWAAVHGIALLLTEGSLRFLPPEQRAAVVDRTLDTVGRGL
jgi:AcrR family transcriptional regulator